MSNTVLHIDIETMDKNKIAHLADATIDLVKQFSMQPGGRERLEKKIAELKNQHFL